MVAPPAMPDHTAMCPAWRPMTSQTITRWWDSAVVCSRSMASVAICTAVSKPKVISVALRSLSMVLGTPTTGTPSAASLSATPSVSSPPMAIRASMPSRSSEARQASTPPSILNGLVRDEPSTVPPRGRVPRIGMHVERSGLAVDHPSPAVEEAEQLVAELPLALADHGPDHGVQAGAVPTPGEHGNPHFGLLERRRP